MTHSRVVRLTTVALVAVFVLGGRVDAQFPKEGADDFESMLNAAVAAIKPLPEAPIPDDPPPHEGALIDLPYVAEPPDLLLVEVLEALPGRPISGERLVRPDGTIGLGFYGAVHVRGLTLVQIKVKIIEHLRIKLPDTTLGLLTEGVPAPFPVRGPTPGRGPAGRQPRAENPPPRDDPAATSKPVAPEDSDRVFVDVSAHNSKFYYVQGDVAAPGKLPWTGSDTVLAALQYAGGFLHTADPAAVRLVRPARGGKPTRVYLIDYNAITEGGEKSKNYQVFPGDRIIVGRNRLVQSTILIDRLAASFQSLVTSLSQASSMSRNLVLATPDLTPAQRETLVKEWFEIVWRQAGKEGGPTPDEGVFREMLLRLLRTAPQAAAPSEKK